MAGDSDDHSKMSNRLGQAIHNGELEHVRMYIEQGVNLNRQCSSEIYPLAIACHCGHEEIMEELLKSGADPNPVSGRGSLPAMFMAAERRVLTLSMMSYLISHGADVNFTDHRGMTILHYLARGQFNDTCDNILSAARLVLDNGASFYALDRLDCTPLFEACRCCNIDLVKLFIAKGADVNSDIGHKAMLRGAADSCNIDMFDLLLNAGANRHLTPDALHIPCVRNKHAIIMKILDTCDVNINTGLRAGMTILHFTCEHHHISHETVRLLLDRGADVRAVSDTGDTAIHYVTIKHCDCNKIRHLLSYNPSLEVKNNKNQTPLVKVTHDLIASKFGDEYERYRTGVLTFKMLVTAGAKITTDIKHRLKRLEAQILDNEIRSTRSLKEMCRFVIRGAIPVPVDVSLCKLPIPKLSQEYLNFPEFDQLLDELAA